MHVHGWPHGLIVSLRTRSLPSIVLDVMHNQYQCFRLERSDLVLKTNGLQGHKNIAACGRQSVIDNYTDVNHSIPQHGYDNHKAVVMAMTS